ncbi:HK97 family phage prohead protease [Solidesulfovibrio sp.]
MSKFIDSAQFRAAPKADQPVQKSFNIRTKGLDVAARTVEFVASTEAVDRMGDSIKLDGWRVDQFKQNPVILFGHDHHALPIGKALAVGVENGALVVVIQFASAEANPEAEKVFRLIEGGFLNAVSVGFIPIRWEFVDDTEAGRCGLDILEAELLEISVVCVPALAEALVRRGFETLNVKALLGFLRREAGAAPEPEDTDADTAKGDAPEELPDDDAKGDEAPADDTPEGEDGCDKPEKAFSVKRAGLVCRFLKLKRAA